MFFEMKIISPSTLCYKPNNTAVIVEVTTVVETSAVLN